MSIRQLQVTIIETIKKDEDNSMAVQELVDKFYSRECDYSFLAHAVNGLVREGRLRQFHSEYDGRKQNHYELVK
jgi:hypothetical protein